MPSTVCSVSDTLPDQFHAPINDSDARASPWPSEGRRRRPAPGGQAASAPPSMTTQSFRWITPDDNRDGGGDSHSTSTAYRRGIRRQGEKSPERSRQHRAPHSVPAGHRGRRGRRPGETRPASLEKIADEQRPALQLVELIERRHHTGRTTAVTRRGSHPRRGCGSQVSS